MGRDREAMRTGCVDTMRILKTIILLVIIASALLWGWLGRDVVVDKMAAVLPESAVRPVRAGIEAIGPTVDPIAQSAAAFLEKHLPAVAAYLPAAPKPAGDKGAAAPDAKVPAAKTAAASAGATPATAPTATPRRETPPVPVTTTKVEKKATPVVLDVVGTVQAIASIPIKSRVDSQIDSVQVKEGDHVKQGDVLFTLDARALQAQLAQARATLARDEAQLQQYKNDLNRAETLARTNAGSQQTAETSRTQVATQQAVIAASRAAVENLEVQLTYYTIKSPIDGRVGSLPLKAGSAIRSADSTLLATVNQLDPVYVSFAAPQAVVPTLVDAMREGPVKVRVTLGGTRGKTLDGTVTFTENTLDTTSGTLTAKATVGGTEERLLPGEFVQVRVILSVEPDALVVPDQAVQMGQAGAFVYVVKPDQTVETRQIRVARTVDRQSVVSSGLTAGETVVTEGQLRLFPGAKIAPAASNPPATAETAAPKS